MIELKNLNKSYGDNEVLKDINLKIDDGEVVVIIGPSGSGKSTLLRCMNLLEQPTSGEVKINGQKVSGKVKSELIRETRQNVGMVFQHFNLFPHYTVLNNIIHAPMIVKKQNKEEAINRAKQLLKEVSLENKMNSFPSSLSGGQEQRIAIARALAMNPNTLLFDEPTSALDP
ncbi:MAG TPA: amino acid ABC transporter ATP-binding protein, partial [Companilactobacillus farciminis]|nr:amino acid ABC transporter ATP-binding protein [Companilactobacillus farciminis]